MSPTASDDRRALLQSALHAIDDLQAKLGRAEAAGREPIAIIGMSCRFPGGATSPEAYWDLLVSGRDAVSEYPAQRRAMAEAAGVDLGMLDDGTRWYGGFLDEIDQFDPQFFGVSPREAATMDPQQRLVLEVSWEALERAGIAPDSLNGTATGVFVGITGNEYIQLAKLSGPENLDVYSATGGALNAAPGRIAYTLGLQGPCMAIDTACSSSLVALHQACQSLRTGESNLALAGGVNLLLLPEAFVCFNKWGMMAPDGRCKTFDDAADGFVRGEGCGIVVLKRLHDAVADGDQVLAVIRGSAVNQDGRSSGLTVPNGLAQQAVLRQALANGAIEPSEVQYFEAHGTGTTLGDPIEIEAMGSVLGLGRAADQQVVVGSVKTNIGHLESASGIAGVIKVVLAMQHHEIPPNLHFHERSQQIPWPPFPVTVPTEVTPWPAIDGRRIAGVSGFGFSGTNAHVVLESAPETAPDTGVDDERARVVVLSARNEAALQQLAALHATWIDDHPKLSLADVCATLNTGRASLPQRVAIVAESRPRLVELLAGVAAGAEAADSVVGRARRLRVAFLFTGQGAQYAGMSRGLYDAEPVFRAALDRCAALMDPLLPQPLLTVVFAAPDSPAAALLDQTGFTQPALFAVEFALAELWRSWGVVPDVMLGHSIGEVVAAAVAGVFSLEDAARLIVARGSLMQALPSGGAMTAIFAPLPDVEPEIADHAQVAVAGVNGPAHTVIAGNDESVAAIAAVFAARGVRVQPLTVSHAFHSPLMLPMLDEFRRVAESVTYRPPQRKVVSNVTGALIGAELASAEYWVRHVMAPVQFADGMNALRQLGVDACVEIGPHPVLTNMGRSCIPEGDVAWVPSLRRTRDDVRQIMGGIGALFVVGARVDWSAVRPGGRRGTMPTYPFQRQRHWLDPAPRHRRSSTGGHPLLGATTRAPLLGATIHESLIAADSPAWLGDHRLSGTIVFPATAYTEMVLASVDAAADVVESMSFIEALIVPEAGDVTLQTVVTEGDGAREVRIVSLRDAAAHALPYTVHARATVKATAPSTGVVAAAPSPVNIASLTDAFSDEIDVGEYYEHLRSIGLTYGPTFRGLSRLFRRDGAALGFVDLPGDVTDGSRYLLHPALFDACFHVLGVAVAPLTADSSDDMFVPVAIDGLRVHRSGVTAAWCAVTLLDADDAATANTRPASLRATLQLYDADGEPVATVGRLEVRRTPRSMWQRALGATRDPVYELTWRSVQRSEQLTPATREWLIVADRSGAGAGLAAELEKRGGRCTLVDSGTAVADLAATVTDALERASSPVGVVYLRGLDSSASTHVDLIENDVEHALRGALHVVQSLAEHAAADVRLWLVTRNAQSIEGEPSSIPGATLWGLGRVAANELPRLGCTCVDIDAVDEPALAGLAEELVHADEQDQVGLRRRQRLVARLTPADMTTHRPPDPPYTLLLAARGSFEGLAYAALERRPPGADEIEVEVRATGINFRDVLNVLGMYPGDPGMPGLECAGVVTAVGAAVSELAVGDAVVGIAPHAFDSHVVTRADLVVRKPGNLTFAEAATVPIACLTAAYGLQRLAKLQRGERVLIHAAAGGVGMAAVQLALRVGAEIFATVGSAEKRRVLEQLGVRHIYSSRTLDFAEQILADTGGAGVDVVLNSLSDDFIGKSFTALSATGRFLEIGKRGIWSAEQAAAERPGGTYHVYDLADFLADAGGIQARLQEVVDDIEAGRLAPLPLRAFAADDVEHAFRYMAQARHIGKVVLTHKPTSAHIRADGSYVVTGGLGGLGLTVAAWLVEQGARHLTLAGRSASSPAAEATIADLEAAGATVRVVTADVAGDTAVQRVLATATAGGAQLRGVFHLAGVIDDGALGQQTWTRFERVLAPKLTGALLLDRATRHLDLDHFVLFSSASALLGAPGQSGYAAANNALDAIARTRRAKGLPALSINWGAWAEAGMAARLDVREQQRLADRGVGALESAVALDVMDRLIGQTRAQAAVLAVDWQAMLAALGVVAPPLLAELTQGSIAAAAPSVRRRLVAELVALDVGRRRDHVRAVVAEQVVAVLGLDEREAIDGRQGLTDLGMDSLMAVELGNRLSALLDRSLPSTIPFEYPTLDEMTVYVEELLAGEVEFAVSMTPDQHNPIIAHDPILDMTPTDVEDALLRELNDAGY
ncbi:MAG: type I polyketide synthase [Ilumatobacteraceae bacterium]|nr:type I polyketide synthase [Ilumatobacteraceae bacterium]